MKCAPSNIQMYWYLSQWLYDTTYANPFSFGYASSHDICRLPLMVLFTKQTSTTSASPTLSTIPEQYTMFVPRQLAIKKPRQATHALPNIPKPQNTSCEPAVTEERPFKRPRIELDIPRKASDTSNKVPAALLSHNYATEAVKCLELLFSEYFTHHVNPQWLPRRMRTVDGHNDCTFSPSLSSPSKGN